MRKSPCQYKNVLRSPPAHALGLNSTLAHYLAPTETNISLLPNKRSPSTQLHPSNVDTLSKKSSTLPETQAGLPRRLNPLQTANSQILKAKVRRRSQKPIEDSRTSFVTVNSCTREISNSFPPKSNFNFIEISRQPKEGLIKTDDLSKNIITKNSCNNHQSYMTKELEPSQLSDPPQKTPLKSPPSPIRNNLDLHPRQILLSEQHQNSGSNRRNTRKRKVKDLTNSHALEEIAPPIKLIHQPHESKQGENAILVDLAKVDRQSPDGSDVKNSSLKRFNSQKKKVTKAKEINGETNPQTKYQPIPTPSNPFSNPEQLKPTSLSVDNVPIPSSASLNQLTDPHLTEKHKVSTNQQLPQVYDSPSESSLAIYPSTPQEVPQILRQPLKLPHKTFDSVSDRSPSHKLIPQFRSACFIPWKGVILEPSYNQIRKYGGNLDLIKDLVGSRLPTEKERNYKQIRIFFDNHILTPSPRELLNAKGDLHVLKRMYPHRASFLHQETRMVSNRKPSFQI